MTAFRSIAAATGEPRGPDLATHTAQDVATACAAAEAAFDTYRATSREERATFLETIAQNILDLGDALIEAAMAESGLPAPPRRRAWPHRGPASPLRAGGASGRLAGSAH
jgi:NADP-dependent aldehyde dehydrogenase